MIFVRATWSSITESPQVSGNFRAPLLVLCDCTECLHRCARRSGRLGDYENADRSRDKLLGTAVRGSSFPSNSSEI